jgi:tetratricopeptide (TPR) repeat protein
MQQGRYSEARLLLDQLLQSPMRPPGVLLNLAIAAIGMQHPDQALAWLDRAQANSDASSWDIRFHRAVAFAQMNRLAEALELFRLAEMERPDDPRVQFNLAITCDEMGLYAQALSHYENALKLSPGPVETERRTMVRRIGTIRRYLGNAQVAVKDD